MAMWFILPIGRLVNFAAVWYILWPFWYVVPRKSCNPEGSFLKRV
jgi:hypothetical protein